MATLKKLSVLADETANQSILDRGLMIWLTRGRVPFIIQFNPLVTYLTIMTLYYY